jgi:hypothetical protein
MENLPHVARILLTNVAANGKIKITCSEGDSTAGIHQQKKRAERVL